MDGGNLLTLWDDAIPAASIPKYPRYDLARAKGGETQFYMADEIQLGLGRTRIVVDEREAEPGEMLRDPILRFIPNWDRNFIYRLKTLEKCQTDTEARKFAIAYSKSSILYFINTFGWCFDPRRPRNKRTPFCTFDIQDDTLTWLVWLIRYGQEGLIEKSRDVGMSWMAVAVSVWLSVFYEHSESLFMSMRQEDVDDRSMGSLLGKVRFFIANLPTWMRAGWIEKMQGVDTEMDIFFPDTQARIKGILSRGTAGRSGRATVCFNDEFAFVEDSIRVLDALSELSDAKVYMSTPAGPFGAFYEMATDPGTVKKTLHWTKHPLKNPEWAKRRRNAADMNEERWSREHEIQYETATVGRVYPEFITFAGEEVRWPHVQEGPFVEYEDAYPTWTTSDLGISDPLSTLWFQIKPVPPSLAADIGVEKAIVFFEEHQARNMTAFDLRYLLNSKDYHYREHILDMRTAGQRDSSGRTWMANMEEREVKPVFSTFFRRVIEPGDPIRVSGKRSPEKETIQQMRNILNHHRYAVVWSKHGCPLAIQAHQSWSFDVDRETRKPKRNDSPRHDQYSHFCKAALYGIDWIYGGAEKKIVRAQDWSQFRVLPRAIGI